MMEMIDDIVLCLPLLPLWPSARHAAVSDAFVYVVNTAGRICERTEVG